MEQGRASATVNSILSAVNHFLKFLGREDILGHSSINTIRIYLMTTGAEHARQPKKPGLVA